MRDTLKDYPGQPWRFLKETSIKSFKKFQKVRELDNTYEKLNPKSNFDLLNATISAIKFESV